MTLVVAKKEKDGELVEIEVHSAKSLPQIISIDEAVRRIEGGETMVVKSIYNGVVHVIVSERNGKKYIKTMKDNTITDDLSQLPNINQHRTF